MLKTKILLGTSFVLMASTALSQTTKDDIVEQLSKQGFTRIEISQTLFGNTKFEATGTGIEREIVLGKDGTVLRDRTEHDDDGEEDDDEDGDDNEDDDDDGDDDGDDGGDDDEGDNGGGDDGEGDDDGGDDGEGDDDGGDDGEGDGDGGDDGDGDDGGNDGDSEGDD